LARGSDRGASQPHDPHHRLRPRTPWARDRDMGLHRRPGRGRPGTPSEFRSSPASVPANPSPPQGATMMFAQILGTAATVYGVLAALTALLQTRQMSPAAHRVRSRRASSPPTPAVTRSG
jgi:hypothetical protein